MAASKLGLLLWFRLLEGDLGGGGNGQHVDHALWRCWHAQSPRMGGHRTGLGSNVGTIVLLARNDAAVLLDGNLLDHAAQAGGCSC